MSIMSVSTAMLLRFNHPTIVTFLHLSLCAGQQVDDDATVEEIKKAYRSLAKECHPDYLGDEGHNICILLNEAYEVRSCIYIGPTGFFHSAPLGAAPGPKACSCGWNVCQGVRGLTDDVLVLLVVWGQL